ncbi:MAG: glycoside hydrolase family 130 protein [bacterium]
MRHLNNSVKRILYVGIVIIFLVISIYQPGFYHNVVLEVFAQSNTNEPCDESLNSEKDFPWMIGPWVKYPHNPILTAGDYEWESKNVLNPTAIVKDGKVYLFYRAQNDKRVSCIGLAISDDGYNFEKQSEPVLVPTEKYEFAGAEDPRIVEIDGIYYMTYTGWIYHTNYLCLAVSKDFIHWEKKGKILPDWPMASKSGAIVPKKINGKYYMYFGDTDIFIATSENLIDWEPQIKPVLNRRFRKKDNGERYFDSLLVEPGPTPIITEQGILLIYNGANFSKEYATGEVLFSLEDPRVVLKRTDTPVLEVDNILEEKGEVNNVVFSEGLVQFNGKWFLYFGMGDSRIGVAVADLKFVQ